MFFCERFGDTVSVMEGQYQNGLTDGMPLELIAKYTGLAPEEIAPL